MKEYNEMQKIIELKAVKDAVLLAHYYVSEEVQAIADYIGDSFYLSKIATKLPHKVICFAGVTFMGESVKLLNPEKTVLLPDPTAVCPMAEMADVKNILKMRETYDDLAVVCYINSSTTLKAHSDVCITSANAVQIVRRLPNKNIYLIPDGHLGAFIASQVPEKNIILNDGFCPVHHRITREAVTEAKSLHPNAMVLSHPECRMEVLELSDYIGSTSEIISAITASDKEEFILCTELGVCAEIKKQNPSKQIYGVMKEQCCMDMKKITLPKILHSLETLSPCVEVPTDLREKAMLPLKRMLELVD